MGEPNHCRGLRMAAEGLGDGTISEKTAAQICRLAADHIESLEARVRELEAVVERLPKTADGVPVVPGDTVYAKRNPSDDTIVEFEVADYEKWTVDAWGSRNQARAYTEAGGGWVVSRHCYSTPEAAEAARQSEGGG